MIVLKLILILLGIFLALFLLTLIIYFFNLDMKLAAAMTPVMHKYYDWQKRKRKKADGKEKE
ncbi:MAG: hypothetical protein J6B43_11705 [Lachnospiraceae bacterium]|nr:hypothetical protein [Lachnospiraceae bacterium]